MLSPLKFDALCHFIARRFLGSLRPWLLLSRSPPSIFSSAAMLVVLRGCEGIVASAAQPDSYSFVSFHKYRSLDTRGASLHNQAMFRHER
jgi:hypothetical protein